MRTCPNPQCGTLNTDDARFCVVCGTRMADATAAPPANVVPPATGVPPPPTIAAPSGPPPATILAPSGPPPTIAVPPAAAPTPQYTPPSTPPQPQYTPPGSLPPQAQYTPPPPKQGGIPVWAIIAGAAVVLLLLIGGGIAAAVTIANNNNTAATATAVALQATADSQASATAEARASATAAARTTATAAARASATAEAVVAMAEAATAEAAAAEAATAEAATAEAVPTPDAGPTTPPIAVGGLSPITANFNTDEGWYTEKSDEVVFGLIDNAYRFDIKVANQIAWDEFKQEPAQPNYIVWVRGRVTEQEGGLYAIFNYETGGKNFYAFGISSDGQYRLTAREDGKLVDTNLIDWKKSSAIKKGNSADNTIQVIRRGPKMEFYVNDELVDTYEDERLSGGYAGVGGESYDKTGAIIDITGFGVTPLVYSDFEDGANPEHWSEEEDTIIKTELLPPVLAMTIKLGDSSAYASRRASTLPADNFILQADMAVVENPDEVTGGIYFNYDTNSQSFYRLLVWSGGKYKVTEFKGKDATTVLDWTDSTSINRGGEVNTVRVDRVGSTLLIFINGTLVKQLENLDLTGGSAGVSVVSFQEAKAGGKVLFDNVIMGALP